MDRPIGKKSSPELLSSDENWDYMGIPMSMVN